MDCDALLNSIAILNKRKEQLLREVDEIDLEIRTQTAKYTRIANDNAPIYRLPNELLTNIFFICQRSVVTSRKIHPIPFQVIISHVSHHLRTIVLSTPLLWNTIDFRIYPLNHTVFERVLSQLNAHLTRSEGCFLDITLDFMLIADLSPYFSLLARHASRWRRLSIATSHEQVRAFEDLLCMAETPILEHLSLSLGRPQDESESGSPRKPYPTMQSRILSSSPFLSFVRLAGHALGQLHPPLSYTTTLHLDGWTRHFITTEQLKSVLEAAPHLINLSLNQLFMHHSRDPLAVPKPVTLLHLRQLRLRGPCSPAARFLSLVDAPSLEALALQHLDTFDSGVLYSLRHVTIDACALDEVELEAMMAAFPGVVTLSIDDSLPYIFTLLLPADEPGTSRLWSNLDTLMVRELQSVDVPHFRDLLFRLQDQEVESGGGGREEKRHGLSTVCLDRRSRTVLRAKHLLDWLHERVRVQNHDDPEPWPARLGYEDPHDLFE